MRIREMMLKAIEKKEFIKFLCGENEYKIELSQYVSGMLPTDTGKILADAIYMEYESDVNIKERFENAIIDMINGSVGEAYMAVVYFMDVLFDEKHGIATFITNKERILPCLNKILGERKTDFMKEITFADGIVKKEAWKDIIRWNKVCQMKYGITILDEYLS